METKINPNRPIEEVYYNGVQIPLTGGGGGSSNEQFKKLVDRTITEVTAEDLKGVTVIGAQAFIGCGRLSKVAFVGSINYVGSEAFSYTTFKNVQEREGDRLSYYGPFFIGHSWDMDTINLREGTKGICGASIGSSITSINIPNSLRYIGEQAFSRASNLREITLNEGLETIHSNAFLGSVFTSLVIPDSVISLGFGAFQNCRELKTIKLGINCKNIPGVCFSSARNLINVNFPDTVETIGVRAFSGCDSLQELRFPASLKSIGEWVFADCYSLNNIYISATIPPIIEARTFEQLTTDFRVHVPSASAEAYKTATNWSKIADRIVGDL